MVNGVGAASDCIPVDDYIAAEDRVVMDAGESRKEQGRLQVMAQGLEPGSFLEGI